MATKNQFQIGVGAISPRDVDAIFELNALCLRHDGVAAISEAPMLRVAAAIADHTITHLRALGDDGELLGYAQVDRGGAAPSAELAVAPLARGHGIGTALLAAAELDARLPLGAGLGAPPAAALQVWAHGDITAARLFAAAQGYVVTRELLHLRWPLDVAAGQAPGRPFPEGHGKHRLRAFRPGDDDDAWVALNAEVFATHPEQGRLTVADLQARMGQPWFDADKFLLVEAPTGELVAYCWLKVTGDAPCRGEVYAIGVQADHRRHGLAAFLLAVAHQLLAEAGIPEMVLSVDADNEGALAVYERAGFVVAGKDVQYAKARQ